MGGKTDVALSHGSTRAVLPVQSSEKVDTSDEVAEAYQTKSHSTRSLFLWSRQLIWSLIFGASEESIAPVGSLFLAFDRIDRS